jgi:hypothetical protein
MTNQDRLMIMDPERYGQSGEARLSVVGVGGEPIWEACSGGLCVRGRWLASVGGRYKRLVAGGCACGGLILADVTDCDVAQQKGTDQP